MQHPEMQTPMARPHPTPQKHHSPSANPNGTAQKTTDLTKRCSCAVNPIAPIRISTKIDHAIAMHQDASKAYEECDPITSLSMVLGSFLLAQGKKRGSKERWCLVVYQPPNSMLIMAVKFQTEFEHAVPSFTAIQTLVEGERITWMDGEPPIKIVWTRNSKAKICCRAFGWAL